MIKRTILAMVLIVALSGGGVTGSSGAEAIVAEQSEAKMLQMELKSVVWELRYYQEHLTLLQAEYEKLRGQIEKLKEDPKEVKSNNGIAKELGK